MKTTSSGILWGMVSMLLAVSVARSGAGAVTEELAVVQAIARILNGESSRPYDYLYYQSDFSAKKNVSASLTDPDRTQFCGLSRDEGVALVKEITFLNMEPLEYDKTIARDAGLNIGHKQYERFRYLKFSRVVFAADLQQAWLAADLNGESGALYKLEKVNGEWSKTARCAGWMKSSD